VLNAANEAAVAAFIARRIGFCDIAAIVERVLDRYGPSAPACVADVVAIDSEARVRANEIVESQSL
jgi:1-deoxy-D-xylulose-5-phosphate reductoisomerase